jgi:DNA replicative helicase MCM subunit Mcm2 (Cdc46/Mcm family)
VNTRQAALQSDAAKPITARDLGALERLTIERAKCELRDVAVKTDAECAIRIYCNALETIGLTPETAGTLESVMSDAEMQVLNDAENMIIAKMKQYDLTSVDDLLLSDIKHEIGVICYGLGLKNSKEILNTALSNVKKNIKNKVI